MVRLEQCTSRLFNDAADTSLMQGDIVLSLPLFGRSYFLTFNLFNFDFQFCLIVILFLFFFLGTPNNDASKLGITLWMHANSNVTRDPPHLHRGDAFLEGGVIVRGTPFRHAFPSRTLLLLPTPPPPSDTSSAFQCVFRLQMRLPLRDSSYASRPVSCTRLPRYVSSPAAYLVSRGTTCLPLVPLRV